MPMQNTALKENLKLKGRVIIRRHPAGSIEKFKQLIKEGRNEEYLALLEKGEIAVDQQNLIMEGAGTGTDIIAQWLASSYLLAQALVPVPVGINYGAIGTGATAPAIGDTQLTTEFARASISFYQNNSSYSLPTMQFFFSDSQLTNQTYPEFGCFANATGAANSGNIFNHALFASAYVKTAGTDTTCQVSISLT